MVSINTLTIALGIFTIAISIQSAYAESEPFYYYPEQADLERAMSIWNAQGLRDYDFKYTKIDSNPQNIVYPWLVSVQNGKPSAKDGNGNQILWAVPPDVPHLFSGIQDQILHNARHIDVQYADMGYPRSIYIIKSDGQVWGLSVNEFRSGARGIQPNGGGSTTAVQTRNTVLRELADAQALWASKAPVNYSYQLYNSGANPHKIAYPWSVLVRNGNDASGRDANGHVIASTNPHPYTMEELFARIHEAYSQNVPLIEARYDKVYGYPEDIHIKYNQAGDSDFHVKVYAFRMN